MKFNYYFLIRYTNNMTNLSTKTQSQMLQPNSIFDSASDDECIFALSMMQPYAWLFSHGYLKIDDRPWATLRRGTTVIHASKKINVEYYNFILNNTTWDIPKIKDLEFGGVVGIANIVDCISHATSSSLNEKYSPIQRSHFGAHKYFGFVFNDARPIKFKETRGMPGFFKVNKNSIFEVF